MENYNTLLTYFKFFASKDLEGLSELFDENVTLTDWEIGSIGKSQVLESNLKIFNSVQTIKVDVINILQKELTYACQLIITINNKEKIEVIDFIKFNEFGKIVSVKAYKG